MRECGEQREKRKARHRVGCRHAACSAPAPSRVRRLAVFLQRGGHGEERAPLALHHVEYEAHHHVACGHYDEIHLVCRLNHEPYAERTRHGDKNEFYSSK